jgi:hypothetical protein
MIRGAAGVARPHDGLTVARRAQRAGHRLVEREQQPDGRQRRPGRRPAELEAAGAQVVTDLGVHPDEQVAAPADGCLHGLAGFGPAGGHVGQQRPGERGERDRRVRCVTGAGHEGDPRWAERPGFHHPDGQHPPDDDLLQGRA